MKENRIVFVDYLRVVACFLVMLVHASENFYAADASGLATYAKKNGLAVTLYQDYGWPAKKLEK